MADPQLLRALAASFLAGEQTVEQVLIRGEQTLGRSWPWLRPLAHRYVDAIAGETRPRLRDVVKFLNEDAGFRCAWSKHSHELSVAQLLTQAQRMQPVAAAKTWDVPAIESVGALADWLWVEVSQLEWFADLKGLGRCAPLDHYHYRILPKRSGNIRLIEAPKRRLKRLQRQILEWILNRIPTHPAAHGFVKARSISTFVTPHVQQSVVLRMDLQDFFPSFAGVRIQTFFRTLGYPECVADLLGGLCTNAVPCALWDGSGIDFETKSLYSRPHLPQGAPTSPALANLCAYRLDCRLSGLAKSVGGVYTRYADDLAISGGDDLARRVERFATHIAAILAEEGFNVHHRKTRIMRQGVRQHLAGLVANQRVNVIRSDFDHLKAILTNCVCRGPESQNRQAHPSFRAHLEGRISFVAMIHPERGKRLQAIFDRIQW